MTATKQQYTRAMEITVNERYEIMHAMQSRLIVLRDRIETYSYAVSNNVLQSEAIDMYYTTAGYLLRNHWMDAKYLELRVWAA